MGDQTSLVSRQEREANAKNQPMFRKRLFKDILIAISGSFRTGTSNTACCMMSFPWLPFTLTIGKLRKRAQQNIREDNVLPLSWHATHISSWHAWVLLSVGIYVCMHTHTQATRFTRVYKIFSFFVCYLPMDNKQLLLLNFLCWHQCKYITEHN